MAERIVSPEFLREKDCHFYLKDWNWRALIGSAVKGPFRSISRSSFQEFQQVFGGLTEDSYLPYTAQLI